MLVRVALLALCLLSLQPPLAGTAVVDRIEGRQGVLVFDDGHERVVALDRLPPPARNPNAVVRVVVGERLRYADFRPAATRRRARHAQARFDRLTARESLRSPPWLLEESCEGRPSCGLPHSGECEGRDLNP